jgi:hypothetical protein
VNALKHKGSIIATANVTALVFIAGCVVVPLPTSTTEPEAIVVNATRTDREITTFLPREIALDYIRSHPSQNRCVVVEQGIQWFNGQTYPFSELEVIESQAETNREYFIWLLRNTAGEQQLLCTWNHLTSEESEKLLTVLVSLGARYS